MQNVVDIQKREAMRQGDVAAQGQAYGATQVGAFGGSRDAIVQAENERNQQTLLNDIQAKGSAAAYADAQQQYAAQQKNALAAGQQFGMMGSAVPGQAMKEFGALESVGAAKQQQEQQALNLAKQQFIQEQTFPEANLQQYSSIIRGYNLPPNTYQSAQAVTPAPSYMQQIAGLGMAGAGIAGAFGNFGKKEGGLVGLAKGGKVLKRTTGGGLGAIPLKRAGGGMGTPQGDIELLATLPEKEFQSAVSGSMFSPDIIEAAKELRSNPIKQEKEVLPPRRGGGLRERSGYGNMPINSTPQQPVPEVPSALMKPNLPGVGDKIDAPLEVETSQQSDITSSYKSPSSDALSQPAKPLLAKTNRNVVDTSAWDDLIKSPGKTGDDTRKAMNDLRGELAVKLDETSEKQKGILNKRQDELGKQKWMALAEMGASVLAQPGGQTFLQAMGKGVKESGIIGTLAKIGDKSSDLDKDLAEMDVKTMMSKYGLKREELLDINDQKKQDLEERKARSDAVFNKERIRIQDDKNLTALEHATAMSELQRKRLEETGYHNREVEQIRRNADQLRSENSMYRTAATITDKFQKAGADMPPAQLEANLKRYPEGSPEYNGLLLSQRSSGSFILGKGQAGTGKAP